MKKPARFLLIYGSVTGNAESIAGLISEEAMRRGLDADLHCMSKVGKEFDITKESTVVIVSSTTGDGEQPENAEPFWRRIRRKTLEADCLSHLHFTILGLGDSNYTNFCNGPKTLYNRMTELGAKTFYDPGWADNGVGLEITVEPWLDNLWAALALRLDTNLLDVKSERMKLNFTKSEKSPKEDQAAQEGDIDSLAKRLQGVKVVQSVIESEFDVPAAPAQYLKVTFEEANCAQNTKSIFAKFPLSDSDVVIAKVSSAELLSHGPKVKKTYLVTLDLLGTDIKCEPGDSLAIICPNREDEVDRLLSRLGLEKQCDKRLRLLVDKSSGKRNAKVPDFLPAECSLRQVFLWHIDIRSIVKKPLLRCLADHTSDPSERTRLLFLCSKQGSSEYLSSVRGGCLCLLDLLLTFESCLPPADLLLQHLPRLQPRPYSAASVQREGLVDIVFSVVEIPKGQGRMFPRRGLCTGWMQDWIDGQEELPQISLFARSNKTFRHPEKLSKNLIMIGPGTGIAPFRGFLQWRNERRELISAEEKEGKAWLFFGCRHKEQDFIFESDLTLFLASNTLSKLFLSFSRDEIEGDNGTKYVQDNIRQSKKDFVELLLEEDTILYVCGDAKNMARDVNDTVISCLVEIQGISLAEAKSKVANLILEKRFLQDIWCS